MSQPLQATGDHSSHKKPTFTKQKDQYKKEKTKSSSLIVGHDEFIQQKEHLDIDKVHYANNPQIKQAAVKQQSKN